MPGAISPPSDEAGSSGHADVPKTLAVDAASSDDLVGVAQPDVQQQQETWVKYNSLQEGVLHHNVWLLRLPHMTILHPWQGLFLVG